MNEQRWRALSGTAEDLGVEIIRLGPFLPTLEQGVAAADVGLASGVSALVAFNDMMAIGALQRLARRGIAVPDEISVVGFDDIFGADFCHPPLSTVSAPVEEAGRLLVDQMLTVLAGSAGTQLNLPSELRIRESTGPVPIGPST